MRLRFNDRLHVEGVRLCHHAHQRQADEHFVAQGLRRSTHRPQQRVFVVARPAGEQHGVYRQAGHHQEEQNTDVEVGHRPGRTDRDDGKCQQQGSEGDHRRQGEDHPVGEFRNPVFLEEHFDHVGDQLQRTAPADTVWSVTVLEQAEQATFAEAHESTAGDDDQQDHYRFKHGDQNVDHLRGKPAHRVASRRFSTVAPTNTGGIPGKPSGKPTWPWVSVSLRRTGRRSVWPAQLNSTSAPAFTPSVAASAGFTIT
ncbi:hypothetical protein D3C71_1506420 [compost metagenome]